MTENSPSSLPRAIWLPHRDEVSIHMMMGAFSDPIRLRIVRRLSERNDLRPAHFLDVASKQGLSHQLAVLRDAGIPGARYEGRNKVLWLRRDLIDGVVPGLLEALLRALAAHADV